MSPEPIVIIRSMTVETRPAPDRLTRWLFVLIALGLAWLALRPHVLPPAAEAGREVVQVNTQPVGRRYLIDGVIPMRCEGRWDAAPASFRRRIMQWS
jgi:hypothetical protein